MIMAKFELKFVDVEKEDITIQTSFFDTKEIEILIKQDGIVRGCIYLDKSTAIKFAKTLRTEINKITESEVDNE
jgi:ABC-type Zn uptake system ZnuABC Zn-binding protein ZnuA